MPRSSSNSSVSEYEVSESSDASSTSSLDSGRGKRTKRKKRNDDSLAKELEKKLKRSRALKPKVERSKPSTSSKKKDRGVKPTSLSKQQREVAIKQSQKIAQLTRSSTSSTSGKDNCSPSKEALKQRMRELEAKLQEATASQSASASTSTQSSKYDEAVKKLGVSDKAMAIVGNLFTQKEKSEGKSEKPPTDTIDIDEDFISDLLYEGDEEVKGNSDDEFHHEEEAKKTGNLKDSTKDVVSEERKIETEEKRKVKDKVASDNKTKWREQMGDFKSQLLFSEEDDNVVELYKGTGIFVDADAVFLLDTCCKSHTSYARGLLEAVFCEESIITCSLKGGLAKGPLGKPAERRKGLHPKAIIAISKAAKKVSIKKGWKVYDNTYVLKQMGTKQSEMRSLARDREALAKGSEQT